MSELYHGPDRSPVGYDEDGLDVYEPDRAPAGHAFHSEEVWAAARDYYFAGCSAPQICDYLGIGVSTFRARAAKERWRRADQRGVGPLDLDQLDPLDAQAPAPPPPVDLAERAFRRAAAAVDRGRLLDAQGWLKVTETLRRLAATRLLTDPPAPATPRGSDGQDGSDGLRRLDPRTAASGEDEQRQGDVVEDRHEPADGHDPDDAGSLQHPHQQEGRGPGDQQSDAAGQRETHDLRGDGAPGPEGEPPVGCEGGGGGQDVGQHRGGLGP